MLPVQHGAFRHPYAQVGPPGLSYPPHGFFGGHPQMGTLGFQNPQHAPFVGMGMPFVPPPATTATTPPTVILTLPPAERGGPMPDPTFEQYLQTNFASDKILCCHLTSGCTAAKQTIIDLVCAQKANEVLKAIRFQTNASRIIAQLTFEGGHVVNFNPDVILLWLGMNEKLYHWGRGTIKLVNWTVGRLKAWTVLELDDHQKRFVAMVDVLNQDSALEKLAMLSHEEDVELLTAAESDAMKMTRPGLKSVMAALNLNYAGDKGKQPATKGMLTGQTEITV